MCVSLRLPTSYIALMVLFLKAEPESEYGLLHTEKDTKIIREKVKSLQGSYLGYYDAVYKSIVSNQPIAVTTENGINLMKIIAAAIKSSNEQKVITLLEVS